MGRLTSPAFYRQSPPPTTGELNAERAATMTALGEFVGGRAPETCVIADGVISPTSAFVLVDTEDQSAADELVSINTVLSASDTLHDGMLIYLQAKDASRVVTVKNSTIHTSSGSDVVLSPSTWMVLRLASGVWWEVQTSGGLAGDNVFTGDNTFTGEVNVPTPADSDNSTKPATTAWVRNNASGRNPGELVYSLLPLSDVGLHLLDGSLLAGDGTYSEFVTHVAGLIANQPNSSNVYKKGAVQDTNNVLSFFSSADYAKLPFKFQPGSGEPWEIVFKITTSNDVSSQQCYLGGYDANQNSAFGGIYCAVQNSKFQLFLSSNGTTWTVVATGTYTVLANTTYWVKIEYTGSAYKLSYKLTEGDSYVADISATSSSGILARDLVIGGLGNQKTDNPSVLYPFTGTVDLASSYININGSRWWTGVHKAGFVDETEWQLSVRKYGACGLFVYDSVANTLRLPKVTGFLEGTVDPSALGTLVEAGAPNITGSSPIRGDCYNTNAPIGCFITKDEVTEYSMAPGADSNWKLASSGINASLSNPIYGNSDTVQPQAIKGFVYMVVANRTKTQIQADIDQIAADLQLKADADLTNVTDGARAEMARLAAHMGMPSDQYEDITMPSGGVGNVTAPADGYIMLCITGSGTVSGVSLTAQATGLMHYQRGFVNGMALTVWLPVKKNDVVVVNCVSTSFDSNSYFRFIYANGSVTV